jgi:hypothetical protein
MRAKSIVDLCYKWRIPDRISKTVNNWPIYIFYLTKLKKEKAAYGCEVIIFYGLLFKIIRENDDVWGLRSLNAAFHC